MELWITWSHDHHILVFFKNFLNVFYFFLNLGFSRQKHNLFLMWSLTMVMHEFFICVCYSVVFSGGKHLFHTFIRSDIILNVFTTSWVQKYTVYGFLFQAKR